VGSASGTDDDRPVSGSKPRTSFDPLADVRSAALGHEGWSLPAPKQAQRFHVSLADIHNRAHVVHIHGMAKPRALQRYYLFLIAYMRWFGVVFAAMAILIPASNLPWLMRSNDAMQLALNLGGGVAFFLIGLTLYRIGTVVQRRYRAHIAQQIE
jgi:hypothetical protein